jgi:hypothetical protein
MATITDRASQSTQAMEQTKRKKSIGSNHHDLVSPTVDSIASVSPKSRLSDGQSNKTEQKCAEEIVQGGQTVDTED